MVQYDRRLLTLLCYDAFETRCACCLARGVAGLTPFKTQKAPAPATIVAGAASAFARGQALRRSAWSCSANGRAKAASRIATNTVSSPQIVPTTSGNADWSSATPMRCADPGGVLSTTRLPATSMALTQSRTTVASCEGFGALFANWSGSA